MDHAIAHLTEQIELVSAQNRRQQRWLLLLSVMLAGIGLAAARQAQPEVVRARRFEAIDDNGRVLAVLSSAWKQGAPALALMDHKGKEFALLTMLDSGGKDEKQQEKSVLLQLNADDHTDEHFGVTTVMAFGRGGSFAASHGDEETISFGIRDDRAGMQVHRPQQAPLVEIGVLEDKPALQLRDGEGNSLFRAP